MKKITWILLFALLIFSVSACNAAKPQTEAAPGDSMSLTQIAEEITKDVPDMPKLMVSELNAENFASFAFITPEQDVTGVVSEPLIGSIPHSVVLVRAKDASTAAALAADMEKNANPRKWICVEAEKTLVHTQGATVLLVMSTETAADTIAANFDALWQ